MIFVTIGSMFPFDRLIRLMDMWAADHADGEAMAQIGDGSYEPRNMPFVRRLTQAEFTRSIDRSRLVVAHAGMGTVISAGQRGKPLVVLPRIAEFGEHTTDHQIATANWLRSKPGVYVADRNEDLASQIDRASGADVVVPLLASVAPREFIIRIRKAVIAR